MTSFFLGLDVSKGYADFVLTDARARPVEPPFQLDDTFEGHRHLYRFLSDVRARHPQAELFAAAESTGGYENNFIAALRRFQGTLPLRVARLNPAHVRRHVEAEGTRTTTDATSAQAIASYLVAYPNKVRYDEADPLSGLRAQWTFIEQLVRQRTALLNQLESVLYRAHPELVPVLCGKTPAWLLKLLERYPTANRLARAHARTVAKIPYVSRERAEALIDGARHSVASAQDQATAALVGALAGQIRHLDQLIKQQKAALGQGLDLPEEVELLKSFGSVGDYTAVGLLLEIGSVERFKSVKEMAAFFGVHPVFKRSGDGLSGVRMSKQGSSRMRAMLFMITLNALQRNAVIAPLYRRLVEEQGMAKMAAIGVCMHKVLRLFYGMLKHRQPFDPAIEQHHRERSAPRVPARESQRKRRYQGYDASAPISARAQKRRRQQTDSQGVVHTACGMTSSAAAVEKQRPADGKSSVKERPLPA